MELMTRNSRIECDISVELEGDTYLHNRQRYKFCLDLFIRGNQQIVGEKSFLLRALFDIIQFLKT